MDLSTNGLKRHSYLPGHNKRCHNIRKRGESPLVTESFTQLVLHIAINPFYQNMILRNQLDGINHISALLLGILFHFSSIEHGETFSQPWYTFRVGLPFQSSGIWIYCEFNTVHQDISI